MYLIIPVESSKSQLKDIVCRVPQGSILGPLLFILYVNDITSTSNVLDFILFADDTTILYSHENIESQISVVNAELKEISNWFKTNKLSGNANKTNYLILGTSHMTSVKAQQHFNVILDDTVLNRVKITIDENLTWKCHIDCVSKTLSRSIGIMNKLKHFIPGSIIVSIVRLFYLTLTMAYSYGGTHVKFT